MIDSFELDPAVTVFDDRLVDTPDGFPLTVSVIFSAAPLTLAVRIFVELFLQKEKIKQQAQQLSEREREAAEKRTQERVYWLFEAMPL